SRTELSQDGRPGSARGVRHKAVDGERAAGPGPAATRGTSRLAERPSESFYHPLDLLGVRHTAFVLAARGGVAERDRGCAKGHGALVRHRAREMHLGHARCTYQGRGVVRRHSSSWENAD